MAQGAKKPPSNTGVDPYKVGVAERISRAFKLYNLSQPRGKEISQTELGRLVAKRRKLAQPITQAAVSGWMNTEKPSVPDNPTLEAIAAVLRTDVGWLVFNLPPEGRPEDDAPNATATAKKA